MDLLEVVKAKSDKVFGDLYLVSILDIYWV